MIFGINQIYGLSKDRPLSTDEIYTPNDFYGHATILKQYMQLPIAYKIKAAIEHGPFLGEHIWEEDIKASLPCIFTQSAKRFSVLKKKTSKALFSIGPPLFYANHDLDHSFLISDKNRLRKSLLVFPAHSTHWVKANYNIIKYCKFLENLGKNFDSIRVCLYWKDILNGVAEIYMSYGFECVTAGHIYDPLFLNRLKSIIKTSTITTSNEVGTHIGYCIMMGKPHFLNDINIQYTAESEKILKRDLNNDIKTDLEIRSAFSKLQDYISTKQMEIIDRHWGISETKTVEEMKSILEIAEDMFSKGKNFYFQNNNLILEQVADYINKNDNKKALVLINQNLTLNPENIKANYGKAIVLARLEQREEAIKTLTKLINKQPDHNNAQILFEALKRECENRFRDNDIVIASYPRSGNTWLRLLLSDIILQLHGFETDTLLPIHQDNVIPNIHDKNLHKIDPRINLPFRLIKTHQKYCEIPQKTIFLFRHPADALCSYYHFHRRYEHLKKYVEGGIDKFCLQNIDEWCEHMASYINAKNIFPDKIFFISYELLHYQAVMALKRITEFLNFKINRQMLKKAIDNHTFQKQYQQEKLSGEIGTKYSEHFFRKGSVGTHMEELKQETIAHINAKALFLYKQAFDFQNRLDSHHKEKNVRFA